MKQNNNDENNIVDIQARLKERERREVDKMMANPIIHGLNNIVFMVKNDGAAVDIYKKPSADSPAAQWTLMGTTALDQMTYHILLQASILEQKIYMLRDKYENSAVVDLINRNLPPSFGLPTGIDKDDNPTGYTEVYDNESNKGE